MLTVAAALVTAALVAATFVAAALASSALVAATLAATLISLCHNYLRKRCVQRTCRAREHARTTNAPEGGGRRKFLAIFGR